MASTCVTEPSSRASNTFYDVNVLGYEDARLVPRGGMTRRDLEIWTEAINKK